MSDPCVFQSPSVNNAASYINELDQDTAKYIEMYSSAVYGDKLPALYRFSQTKLEVDDVIKRLSYGTIDSIDDLKADSAKAQFYKNALDSAFQALFKASDDPAALIMEANENARILSAYRRYKALQTADLIPYRFFNGITKMFGLGEVYANRPNYIRHFQPAADTYMKMAEIDNFTKSYNTKTLDNIREMWKAVESSSIFKQYKISPDIVNKMFGLFDNMYIDKGMVTPDTIAGELVSKYDIDMEQPGAKDAVFNEFMRFKKTMWDVINYGTTEEQLKIDIEQYKKSHPDATDLSDNKILVEVSRDGSILGNFRLLRDKLNSMWDADKAALITDTSEVGVKHRIAIEAVIKQINEMHGRFGYVPGNQIGPSMLETLYDSNAEWRQAGDDALVFLPAFTFHRVNENFNDDGDFINTALTMSQATGIMFNEAARIIGYNKIKADVDANAEWFKADPSRRAIQGSLIEYLHDLGAVINTPKAMNSTAMKIARGASALIGVTQASILMMPGSAINNTIGANYIMTMVTGLDHFMGRFDKALKSNNGVATMIYEHYQKYLLSPGIVSEFETFTPMGQNAELVDKTLSTLQKVGDRMGDGVLSLIPVIKNSNMWGKIFTGMKPSEERVREHAMGMEFNLARQVPGMVEILTKTTDQLTKGDKEVIRNFIESTSQKVFYDMQATAGDFSPLARPWKWHTAGDTANDPFHVVMGAVGKLMYAFVHPMVVNIDAFVHTLAKTGVYFNDSTLKNMLTPSMRASIQTALGTGSFGFFYAMYEFYRDAIAADKDHVKIGLTETFNPLQNMREPLNLFYASIVAPIIGAPLSEEAYKEIAASNARFALNLLGGREAEAAIREDGGMQEWMDKLGKVMDLPSVIYDVIVNQEYTNGDMNILYDKRAELREAFGGTTASDPVGLIADAIDIAFIRDPQNPNQVMSRMDKDRYARIISKALGISVWRTNPETVFKSYKSNEWREYANNRASRYISKAKSLPYYQKSAAEYQLQALREGYFPKPLRRP
jgi:hypothetical protein